MNKYKVIWFDDEFEDRKRIRESAHLKGISLVGYSNAEEGIEALRNNIEDFDAALLDGIFYATATETGIPSQDEAMGKVAKELLRLENRKYLPWFILSGQDSFTKEKNRFAEAYKDGRVYDKLGGTKEYEKLWNQLIKEANRQKDTQLRHNYRRVFDVCTDKYIGENAERDLLKILLNIDNNNVDNQFNTIRKIVEDIFIACNKFQLLPNEFITPSVAINESSKFLSGKNHKGELFSEKGYKHLEETHIPEQISNLFRNILSVTQDGSHRAKIDAHVKSLNTTYLFQSVLYQLLDVMVWFKIHIDNNPKKENWIKIDNTEEETISNIKKGEVINLNIYKGFAFLKPDDGTENVFIPPKLVSSHRLNENEKINAEIEEYQDYKTNELKQRVKKLIE